MTKELKAALKPGKNVVAVHVTPNQRRTVHRPGTGPRPESETGRCRQADRSRPNCSKLRDARWSEDKAWAWYADVGPIVGCNYLPRTAVNMTEMWQKETFDPKTIDEELGWAEKAGYNSLRVFVQYLVWKDDPEGLKRRMDEFLTIADEAWHARHVRAVLRLCLRRPRALPGQAG